MYIKHVVPSEITDSFSHLKRFDSELWRGPHQGIEIKLMNLGYKKVGLINHVDEVNYCYSYFERFKTYVVTTDEKYHQHVINILTKTTNMFDSGKISWRNYSVRLGRIFGYDKEQIRNFINE